MEEGQVPEHGDHRAAPAAATPGGRADPVDPVGPAVGQHRRRVGQRAARTTRGRARASTRPTTTGRARRAAARAARRATAGSLSRRPGRAPAPRRWPPGPPPRPPARPPSHRPSPGRRHGRGERRRSHRPPGRPGATRSPPGRGRPSATSGSTATTSAPAAAASATSRPGPWRPTARPSSTTTSGSRAPAHGVACGPRASAAATTQRVGSTRQPERGSASTGQPSAGGQGHDVGRRVRHPPRPPPGPAGRPTGRPSPELAGGRRARPPDVATGATGALGPTRRARGPALGDQRVGEGQVEVDRARARRAPGGLGHRPGGQRAARCARPPASGTPGLGEPAHGRAEEPGLVDGLGGARRGGARAGGRPCRPSGAPGRGGPRPPPGAARRPPCRWWCTRPPGRPVARASPRAKKPAPRSSRRTWSAQLGARRPGPGPAGSSATRDRRRRRSRPQRTHSSTRVAAKVAWALPSRSAAVPAVGTLTGRDHRAQTERRGAGPRLVLAHGFTQTGRLWGPFGDTLAAARTAGAGGPARPRRLLGRRGRPAGGRRLLVEAGGGRPGPVRPARLLARAPASPSTPRWPAPSGSRRLVLIGATAGIEDPERRGPRRRQRDEAMADELEADGDLAGFLRRWLAAPMFAGLRDAGPGRAAAQHPGRPGLQPAAGRHRHPGPRCGTAWASSSMPVLVLAGADDARFAAGGRPHGRAARPTRSSRWCPGPATPPTSSSRPLTARLVERVLGRPATGLSSQQDPDGEQQPPTTSCSRPVAPSTGSSSRPSARPAPCGRARRPAAAAARASSAHGRTTATGTTRPPPRPATRRRASRPASGPRRTARVRLPATASPGDVAQVVGLQAARWPAARPGPRPTSEQPGRAGPQLHVGRADGGHHAEEDEHEELAQAEVAVGPGAAGVEPAGGEAGGPDGTSHQRGGRGQGQPGRPGHREGDQAARRDRRRRGQPRADQAQRADPLARRCPAPRRSSRWRSWSRPGRPGPPPGRRRPATRSSWTTSTTAGRGAAVRRRPLQPPARPPCPPATGTPAAARVRGRAPSTQRRTGPGGAPAAGAGGPAGRRAAHGRRGKREKSGGRCST